MSLKVKCLILTILLMASCTIEATTYASSSLILTIQTDKTKYGFGDKVNINGSLTLNGMPVTNALVGLQITDNASSTLIYRTVNTGENPQVTPYVEVLSVLPCDDAGRPKSNFNRGSFAYFKVAVRNNSPDAKTAYLTLNCYYEPKEMPFFSMLFWSQAIPPNNTTTFNLPVIIPETAPLGGGKASANAFTGLPESGGYPYCPEQSATFTIALASSVQQLQQQEAILEELGTYNVAFSLPENQIRVGNYTAYACYAGQVIAVTEFNVVLIGDVNGDKTVNLFDAVLLSKASGSKPGDPNWDGRCDLNGDGVVNLFDGVLLSMNAGRTAL